MGLQPVAVTPGPLILSLAPRDLDWVVDFFNLERGIFQRAYLDRQNVTCLSLS